MAIAPGEGFVLGKKYVFESSLKDYTKPWYALRELVVNAWYGSETNTPVKNIFLKFFPHDGKDCFAVVNDGKFFPENNIYKAIREYGCESAGTPGNENGFGLKGSAAYFIRDQHTNTPRPNARVHIVSKSRDGKFSNGMISSNCQVYVGTDKLDETEKQFIEFLKKEFLNDIEEGSVTAGYDISHYKDFQFEELKDTIAYTFTKGLKTTKFMIQMYDPETACWTDKERIEFKDLFYESYKKFVSWDDEADDIRDKTNVEFVIDDKHYICSIRAINMEAIPSNCLIENDKKLGPQWKYGVFFRMRDGWMSLEENDFYLLGQRVGHHGNRVRCIITAIPIENVRGYANSKDWQALASRWGLLNQAKVQRASVCGRIFRKDNGKKGIHVTDKYKDLYDKVIKPLLDFMNEFRTGEAEAVEFDSYNAYLANQGMIKDTNGHEVSFQMSSLESSDFIGVEKNDNAIIINFNSNHPKWSSILQTKQNPTWRARVEDTIAFIKLFARVDIDQAVALVNTMHDEK